jgi:hypothetical protein
MQDVGSQVTFKRPRNWGYLIIRPSGLQSVNKCSVRIYTGVNSLKIGSNGKILATVNILSGFRE